MATSKCAQCNETVYPLEKMVLAEKPFHRGCAKCSHCQSTLTISSFASANGNLYCKPHFLELFRSSGGKYAFAGEVSSTGTGSFKAASKPEPIIEPTVAEKEVPKSTPRKLSKLATFVTTALPKSKSSTPNKIPVRAEEAKCAMPEQKAITPVDDNNSKQERPTTNASSDVGSRTTSSSTAQSKLSQFLSGASSNVDEVKPAVSLSNSNPIHDSSLAVPKPSVKASSSQAPSSTGMSKLSLFLQQVETAAPVQPLSTTVGSTQKRKPQEEVREVPTEPPTTFSVSDLIQKTETRQTPRNASTFSFNSNRTERHMEEISTLVKQPIQKSPAYEDCPREERRNTDDQQSESSSVNRFREKLAVYKSPLATNLAVALPVNKSELEMELAKLQMEVEEYRQRMSALTQENTELKHRVQQADAQCDELTKEVARLNAVAAATSSNLVSSIKPLPNSGDFKTVSMSPTSQAQNENMIQNSLKHAKKLLSQGKISKAQFEAATRAAEEASKMLTSS